MARKIIDAHAHPGFLGRSVDAVVKNMDEHGIRKAWLLTWERGLDVEDALELCEEYLDPARDGADYISLEQVLRACERYPERFVPFFAPHPKRRGALDRLDAAVRMHGVRGVGEWKFRVPMDDPDCIRVFRLAGEKGLPVIFHLQSPYWVENGKLVFTPHWHGGTIDALERALVACPDTIFLGHAAFWNELASAADFPELPGDAAAAEKLLPGIPFLPDERVRRLFDAHENLYGDLSAYCCLGNLKRLGDDLKAFFIDYQDRLLFARDCFTGDHAELIDGLGLPEEVLEKIYFRNAEKLTR